MPTKGVAVGVTLDSRAHNARRLLVNHFAQPMYNMQKWKSDEKQASRESTYQEIWMRGKCKGDVSSDQLQIRMQ